MRSLVSLVTLVALATLLGAPPPVRAAPPSASPTAGTCSAPPLPPGSPTPRNVYGNAGGTPAAPAPEQVATPGAGAPADAATTRRVTAAVHNLVACLDRGDYLKFAALLTPAFMRAQFDDVNPYDVPHEMAGIAFEDVAVQSVRTLPDGRYVADLLYTHGYQRVHDHWVLVEQDGYLKLDQIVPLATPPPPGAVTVNVTMVDFAFLLDRTRVPSGRPLVLHVANTGRYEHDLEFGKLAPGTTPADVVQGAISSANFTFYGGIYLEPGASGDLVLVNVAPGTYTMLSDTDDPGPVPNYERGMVAQLTVT